jgi:hypothetical protein
MLLIAKKQQYICSGGRYQFLVFVPPIDGIIEEFARLFS